jgi:zinc/manganese transport system substrate-binding protein
MGDSASACSWPLSIARGGRLLAAFALVLGFAGPLIACQTAQSTVAGGVIQVVAAESFWGSIARQLGGSHVRVTSIITDPNMDPHEYASNSQDARAFAQANYVILNGAGYDGWAQKLLDANPVTGRKVLNVADLLGKKQGDNPHFWYSPDYLVQVMNRITNDYQVLDPADAQYFTDQRVAFDGLLAPYRQLIGDIRQAYSGTKIGATESLFVYMAQALGLDLISPPEFLTAVAEGNEPPAQAMALFQQQIAQKQIAVLIYNNQTATVVTTNIKQLAADKGIQTVGVTETLVPASSTFQDWQTAQLRALQNALKSSR